MSDPIIYLYQGCSTCRKAQAWLHEHGIAVEERPIRERSPTLAQLRLALVSVEGQRRRICNTSSNDYRESGLKDRLEHLNQTAFFKELQQNGNMIKRPLLIDGDRALVGFDPERWAAFFGR